MVNKMDFSPKTAHSSANTKATDLHSEDKAIPHLPVQAPDNKTVCDEPAYLFWKIQSQLTKLTNCLREEKKFILDNQQADSNSTPSPSKDKHE